MKNTRKQLILEAHKEACSEWKQKIETEFPKLFVKEELEIGKWYKYPDIENWKLFVTDNTRGKEKGVGINCTGEWMDGWSTLGENELVKLVLCTDQALEQALIKEAKKRGFKKGAYMVHNKEKYPDQQEPILIENNKFELIVGGFCVFGWEIFSNGKWATIIEDKKEMTVSDIEKELGYSVKIVK